MKNLLKNIRDLVLTARKAVAHSVDLIQVLSDRKKRPCLVGSGRPAKG